MRRVSRSRRATKGRTCDMPSCLCTELPAGHAWHGYHLPIRGAAQQQLVDLWAEGNHQAHLPALRINLSECVAL